MPMILLESVKVDDEHPIVSYGLKRLCQKATSKVAEFWVDGLLLVPLLVFAFLYFRITPEFAANLPQDAADFVLPSLNLLKKGRLVVTCYGREIPPVHPFGMPLLLAPSYLIFGNFPGNGIYSILFSALGTVTTVYFIGRRLSGRIGGCFAALFLATHNGFHGYSQKIMSEVPSTFLLALILLWMIRLRDRRRAKWGYCGVGLLAGLAIAVRWDNILVLVPTLALLIRDSWKCSIKRGACIAVGLMPWLLALGLYNQAHHGSALRTGYQYWRDVAQDIRPVFSLRFATSRGYWESRVSSEPFIEQQDGNFLLLLKTFLNQVDITYTFGRLWFWNRLPRGHTYQMLVIARTLLGFVGLVWCIRRWRERPAVQMATLWFISFSIAMIFFYTVYCWQEERFLLRLVPFFCLFNAMGLAIPLALTEKWAPSHRIAATSLVCVLLGGLLCSLGSFSARYFSGAVRDIVKRDLGSDDNRVLFRAMHTADSLMESNAFVVTDFDPFRSELFIVEGTRRTLIPLSKDPWSTLSASNDLKTLAAMLGRGRPGYLFLRDPFDSAPVPPAELAVVTNEFLMQPMALFVFSNGPPIGVYLYRLHLRNGLPFSIN